MRNVREKKSVRRTFADAKGSQLDISAKAKVATSTVSKIDGSALGNENWEIDILGKRAHPKAGYLESRIGRVHRKGDKDSKLDRAIRYKTSKTTSRRSKLQGSVSLPNLIPMNNNLHLQETSGIALQTTLDLLGSKDLVPSPKIIRSLQKNFVQNFVKRRGVKNRLESLSKERLKYSTILNCVAHMKGISRELNHVQHEIESLSISKDLEAIPKSQDSVSEMSSSNHGKRSSFLTQCIWEASDEMQDKNLEGTNQCVDLDPAPGTWEWQKLQNLKQNAKQTAQAQIKDSREDLEDGAVERKKGSNIVRERPQRRHRKLLDHALLVSGFSDLVPSPGKDKISDNKLSDKRITGDVLEDVHTSLSVGSLISVGSSRPSTIRRSLDRSQSLSHQQLCGATFGDKVLLTRSALNLRQDLEAATGLLASHLGPELRKSYNREVARQKAWIVLIKVRETFRIIHSTWRKIKLKKNFILSRNRFAQKIQSVWRAFVEIRIRKKMEANAQSHRHMWILGLMIRCKWRTRTAARVRKFCMDYIDNASRFGTAIRNYRFRIVRVQKMIWSSLSCKRARITALRRRWYLCEKVSSWNIASGVRLCFYHLAQTREREGALYRQRQVEAEKRLESERAKMRPKLRLSLFRVGKAPREAMFNLRVYQDKLSEKKLGALQAIVSDYTDRKELFLLAERYNASLNRVLKLSDTLSEIDARYANAKDLECKNPSKYEDLNKVDKPSRLKRRLSISSVHNLELTLKTDEKKYLPELSTSTSSYDNSRRLLEDKDTESEQKKQTVLRKIKKWRRKERAPKIRSTSAMRRRLRAKKGEANENNQSKNFNFGDSSESTSDYSARRIPKEVVTVVLRFAIEQIRKIHHRYCEIKKSRELSVDRDLGNSKLRGAWGYGIEHRNPPDADMTSNNSDAMTFNGLKNALRSGTVALNEFTLAQLQKRFKQDEAAKFPILHLYSTMNESRMKALMVLAGACAASLSLLSPSAAKKINRRDLSIKVMQKLHDLLGMFCGNFLEQLENFKPSNVQNWASPENNKSSEQMGE